MAVGLKFFNYDTMNQGFLPDWCWGEDDLDFGVAEPKQVFVGPGPRLDCFPERPLTPEEELLAKEALENDVDMIEVGEKITFEEVVYNLIFLPVKSRLEFSLTAAANLAQTLGYTKEELLSGEHGRVIALYLAEDEDGILGMDRVISFFLSKPRNSDVCSAVKTFATRMIPHRPEVSEGFRLELVAAAKNGVGSAMAVGIIIFGSIFKRWVKEKTN